MDVGSYLVTWERQWVSEGETREHKLEVLLKSPYY